MLTQLETLKTRLSIPDTDVLSDDLLTFIIEAVSTRFDQETNRTLARTENATFEFDANDLEISVPCYPIESITRFETKTTESEGWIEATDVDYVIRNCIISLSENFSIQPLAFSLPALARLTYTGGYVLPCTNPSEGQTALPPDLEHAWIEHPPSGTPVATWLASTQAGPKAECYSAFPNSTCSCPSKPL